MDRPENFSQYILIELRVNRKVITGAETLNIKIRDVFPVNASFSRHTGLSELSVARNRATINNKDFSKQFMPAHFYATCSFP